MTSAHTNRLPDIRQSTVDPELSYENWFEPETVHIPVKSKRSYSHRIKVHKRRSIKPQLVKDELKFQQVKTRRLVAYIDELTKARPGIIQQLVNKLRRK